ncbi:MAG: biotin/lipoyl-binding protein, partial [Planctomycetota bacterium]
MQLHQNLVVTLGGLLAMAGLILHSTSSAHAQQFGATEIGVEAYQPSTSYQDEGPIRSCFVKFINNVNVPAEVKGKLLKLSVGEGSEVKEGDVIATIDDTAAKLALELKRAQEKEAQLNAENNVNLRDARNGEELAKAEAASYRELERQGAVPYYEYKKKQLEAIRATLRIELAEMQLDIYKAQYIASRSEREIAEFEITRRTVKAPNDGYI